MKFIPNTYCFYNYNSKYKYVLYNNIIEVFVIKIEFLPWKLLHSKQSGTINIKTYYDIMRNLKSISTNRYWEIVVIYLDESNNYCIF